MPSKTEGGVPLRPQLTTRTPRLSSEYLISRTASPARAWLSGRTRSVPPNPETHVGTVQFARVNRTSLVTLYVPLPVGTLFGPGLNVSQVPPPVTALPLPSPSSPPAGVTKVPEPVSVIKELSAAPAESCPPALRLILASTLMRSHWNWASSRSPLE